MNGSLCCLTELLDLIKQESFPENVFSCRQLDSIQPSNIRFETRATGNLSKRHFIGFSLRLLAEI